MRIAIDIDSTLHDYWHVLSEAARRRFGIELPYGEQFDWGITRLRDDQLRCCIEETHTDDVILTGRPYPGAVETVNRWSAAGHFIHITSHRDVSCHAGTDRWLRDIGLEFDELYCSFDKVARCIELGIDLLIDDSPMNLQQALDHGIAVATLTHPWNEDFCATEDVVVAADWQELAAALEPMVARARGHVG